MDPQQTPEYATIETAREKVRDAVLLLGEADAAMSDVFAKGFKPTRDTYDSVVRCARRLAELQAH